MSSCYSVFCWERFTSMLRLALPNMLSFLAMYSAWVVTIAFVSAKDDSMLLGAVGLGSVIGNVLGFSIGVGLTSALDTLCSQAVGADHLDLAVVYLHRGRVISIVTAVPCTVVLWLTTPLLEMLGQDPHTAALAGEYVKGMTLGLLPFFLYNALCSFLRSHQYPTPSFVVNVVTGLLHIVWAHFLIFKSETPVWGAGLAMCITFTLRFVMLEAYVALFQPKLGAHNFSAYHREAAFKSLGEFVSIAIPSAMLMWSEWWAYEVQAIFAGWVGAEGLAAHVAAANIVSIIYMGPIGLNQSAATLVGNALGAGKTELAECQGRLVLSFTSILYAVVGVLVVILRYPIAHMYTSDPDVVAELASVLLVVGPFCVFDALQAAQEGVLRGLGLQGKASTFKLAAMVTVRLPIGYFMAFHVGSPPLGVVGIWTASLIGMVVTCALYGSLCWKADYTHCMNEAAKRHCAEEAACEGKGTPQTRRRLLSAKVADYEALLRTPLMGSPVPAAV